MSFFGHNVGSALANGPDLVQDLNRPAGSPVRPIKRLFPTRYRIWTLKQAFNTKKQTHARADKDQESSNAPVERTVHMVLTEAARAQPHAHANA